MNDLEITLLCAEAMGLELIGPGNVLLTRQQFEKGNTIQRNAYDPLHNDAQAMALVKKFSLDLVELDCAWTADGGFGDIGESADLNRAICECVAKMQKGK